MTGERNEQRQRAIAEDFVRLVGRDLEIVSFGDKPDVEVQDAKTGRRYGLEVSELLPSSDGRVRALEELACRQLIEACKELFGPGGDIEIRVARDPKGEREVQDWLTEFRSHAGSDSTGRVRFPSQFLGRVNVKDVREVWAACQDRWNRHGWMIVEVFPDAKHDEWTCRAVGRSDTQFPYRVKQIDDLIVGAVEKKCMVAPGYRLQGSLWLCLRNVWIEKPSPSVSERVKSIVGVEKFGAIGLLQLPYGVIDPLTQPSVQCLYGQFG